MNTNFEFKKCSIEVKKFKTKNNNAQKVCSQ